MGEAKNIYFTCLKYCKAWLVKAGQFDLVKLPPLYNDHPFAIMALRLRTTGLTFSRMMAARAGVLPARRNYSEMPLTFATPNAAFYAGEAVKQIDVPSMSGAFGILPSHVPTMAALAPGVVSVTGADGTISKFFVSSGTVNVHADSSVQLLAEEACLLSDIDAHAAREALAAANAAVASAKDEVEKAEAQIAVDTADAVVKALS